MPLARSTCAFASNSTRQDQLSIGVVVSVEVPVPHGSNSTMQIYGPYRVSTTQPNSAPQRSQPKSLPTLPPKPRSAPVDQLDLSSTSSGVNRLDPPTQVAGGGEIRIDRVADIRRQIADGSYETPEKLDAALGPSSWTNWRRLSSGTLAIVAWNRSVSCHDA